MPRAVNTAGAGSESAEQKALVQWWGMMRQHLAPNAVHNRKRIPRRSKHG
jgi:hypothetical protein